MAEKKSKIYNASDPEQIEEAKLVQKFESSEKSKFIQMAMATEGGRRFFYDLLVFCSSFNTPFTADNNKTNFNCGKQTVGFMIIADLQATCPEEYLKMCAEGRK